MKVLFIANSDRHINLCHIPYLKMFKNNNYDVHVATNTNLNIEYSDKKINLGLTRNPISLKNINALIKLRKLVKKEKYDIISCHTPVGGVLGRLCIIKQKLNTKVFYTAHGFHFYKGSNLINWLIYYPIEKYLSKYSTCIITVNEEDFKLASNKFKCDIYKINGIGYDENRLNININKKDLINKYHLKNYYIVSYIAEISKRKNQIKLIKKLNKINLENNKIKVLLIGDSIIPKVNKYIKNDNIIYIDFINDVGNYINISDLIISSSLQEGLPLSILEAMHFNKNIIALNIRGNVDLLSNYKKGILVSNLNDLIKQMIDIRNNKKNTNYNYNMDKYKVVNIINDVKKIYNNYLEVKLK